MHIENKFVLAERLEQGNGEGVRYKVKVCGASCASIHVHLVLTG